MNKTSQSKSQTMIRTVVIFTLCILISLASIQPAKADVAPPPDPNLGGVVPYQPLKTNVQMMSETVYIDILPPPANAKTPKQVRVNASFTMRNQGQTEEQMQVIFPMSSLNTPYADPSDYYMDSSSFVAKVGSRPVSITTITTPAEVSTFMDKENDAAGYFQIRWAAFEVMFPVQQNILLEVQYDMLYNDYAAPYQVMGFDGINYILETGAGWYGNILSADIILHFPYPASEEVISYANPGYVFSGNEMHWQLKDFEPTQKDNLEVRLFRVDDWQTILKLRARIKQNPKDADTWAELGNRYIDYAIPRRDGYISEVRPHFATLAVEAWQNVVDLRPDSGNAHYKLAESLWFNIPVVQKKHEVFTTDVRLDDPSVQQVFRELEQAWAYGVTGTEEAGGHNYFISDMARVFPGLILKPPLITTITIIPPTQTFAPYVTDTALPTALSALIPIASPTPIPTKAPSSVLYVAVIVILGAVVTLGIFVYRSKPKSEGKK